MYYTENLVEEILEKPARNNDELIILSGYGSAKFLREINEKLIGTKLTLIIGMASQGIAKQDYNEYVELCKKHKNVTVKFQVEKPATHMKIYQWLHKGVPTECYIGSANFSYSGFLKNNEIMSKLDNDCLEIITKYQAFSVDCLSDEIDENIKLFDEEVFTAEIGELIDFSESNQALKEINIENLRNNQLKRYEYDEYYTEVTLVFNNGLNRGIRSKQYSYLDIDKNLTFFDMHLPVGETGTLDIDGFKFDIRRDGPSGRRLYILHDYYDFYQIVLTLTVDSSATIEYAALVRQDLHSLKFIYMDKNHLKLGI